MTVFAHHTFFLYLYSRKIVSFWDSRASGRALDALQADNSFHGGKLESELFWDEGHESFADKVRPERGSGGDGGGQRRGDSGAMRGGSNRGGRFRDRSRSPDNRRGGSDSRDNYRDRDHRRHENNDRYGGGGRDDRRGNRDSRYSNRNDDYRAPPPQGQPANLMEILSNSKSVLQPAVPQYPTYAPNMYQQQQLPMGGVAPQGGDTNALLASLLSQTNPQQLISILSQMAPQQQQQPTGYSQQQPPMAMPQKNFGGYPQQQNTFNAPPALQNMVSRCLLLVYPNDFFRTLDKTFNSSLLLECIQIPTTIL